MERNFCFIICALLVVSLLGCGRTEAVINEAYTAEEVSDEALLSENEGIIIAQIDGAVVNPGVYEVHEGDRVNDLVMAAGGMCEDAALESINLAELVTDGMRYHIMTVTEYETMAEGASARVNINTASVEQLMTLAGIGESKAKSIIEYRKKNGSFKSVDDLLNVSGIKKGTLDKIRDDITV